MDDASVVLLLFISTTWLKALQCSGDSQTYISIIRFHTKYDAGFMNQGYSFEMAMHSFVLFSFDTSANHRTPCFYGIWGSKFVQIVEI